MQKLRRKVYMTAGYNTVSLGSGRKEFHPKKPRPELEDYIKEAGEGTLKQIGGAKNVDESVIGNFMASRYNKQGHLAAFIPMIDKDLRFKPSTRVEGACGSGGLALMNGIKTVLAETAEIVLTMGCEVQNTVKAVYGADILAGAGWSKDRKDGHAHFFPGQFSDRAGAYSEKYGAEKTRKALATWFKNAIENARLDPTAQEYHNSIKDLEAVGMSKPNARSFVANLNVFDCSKVSDAACSIAVLSEEGLKRAGISKSNAVEVIGWGQAEDDITKKPEDQTTLTTTQKAVEDALKSAGITKDQLATVECHDCFTVAGVLATEAIGLAEKGKGADYVLEGNTARSGKVPFNTSGGLVGWGHPTGGTGVHQAIVLWQQLTGQAKDYQIKITPERPYGLSINMGGNDKTVIAIVYKKGE